MADDFSYVEDLIRGAFTFSGKFRKELEEQKKTVLHLDGGKSIEGFRKNGLVSFSYLDNIPPDILKLKSMARELAVVPNVIILPGSSDKTLDEQQALIRGTNGTIKGKHGSARLVMLGVADLLDLYSQLEIQGMFDQIPDDVWVRTLNPLKGENPITGYSFVVKREDRKLALDFYPNGRFENVAIAQVISPA